MAYYQVRHESRGPEHVALVVSWVSGRKKRVLLLAELILCFGPTAVMAMLSLATLGPAISQIVGQLGGIGHAGQVIPWAYAIMPIFLSIGAFAGLFALLAVAQILVGGRTQLAYSRGSIVGMALSGIAAIIVIGFQIVPVAPMHPIAILCVYLPLLASAHVITLLRNVLVRKPMDA